MVADGSVVIDILADDSKLTSKLKGLAGSAVKGLSTALAGASAAFGVLSKAAMDGYADYEQLTGGVETLFKASRDAVLGYADNAYRTAGLSANQYMETVTGFSASLLQSLSGDTEKAAEVADRAITDMADNANKMGSSMGSIQNAYQGFAKQNYTMLDNLKLGYGGTKEEMQRLLADAEKLSGRKFDISSYADVVEAIHVVQTEMGITGTTAKEASDTIQGSFASMQAAWENFITGMADPDQDFDVLLGNLVDSALTTAGNLLPRIQLLLPRLVEGLAGLTEQLMPYVPEAVESILPALIQGGMALMSGLLAAMPSLVSALGEAVPIIVAGLETAFPQLMETGMEMLTYLADGVITELPAMLPVAIETIAAIVETMTANASKLIGVGIQVVTALIEGLVEALPELITYVPEIVSNIANVINDNAPKLLLAAATLIMELVKGLIDNIPVIIQNLPKIISTIVDVFTAFSWLNLGKSIIEALKNGIVAAKNLAAQAAGDIANTVKTAIGKLPQQMLSIGRSIVQGLWNGIKNAGSWLASQVKNFVGGIVSTAKNALGIHSPSKVFAEIGGYMAEGLGDGFTDRMDRVAGEVTDAIPAPAEREALRLGEREFSDNFSNIAAEFNRRAAAAVEGENASTGATFSRTAWANENKPEPFDPADVITEIRSLKAAVSKGGDVYLDGKKVGRAVKTQQDRDQQSFGK